MELQGKYLYRPDIVEFDKFDKGLQSADAALSLLRSDVDKLQSLPSTNIARDFLPSGYVTDGSIDYTLQIQRAVNSLVNPQLPSGTFKIGLLTIPSTVKSFTSESVTKIIPGSNVPIGMYRSWILGMGLVDALISGVWLSLSSTIYSTIIPLDLESCVNTYVDKVRVDEGGRIGIYGYNCKQCTVSRSKVYTCSLRGIQFEGESQVDNTVMICDVDGVVSSHGIAFQSGTSHKSIFNKVKNVGGFGVSLYLTDKSDAIGNTTYNTGNEGVNTEDGSYNKLNLNTCSWPVCGSRSTDFGMSIYGSTKPAKFNQAIENTVINSGKSGIAVAGNVQYTQVKINTVHNCNRLRDINHCGVVHYGTGCTKNSSTLNTIVDETGVQHTYGVGEINFGTGMASGNKILGNDITGYKIAETT